MKKLWNRFVDLFFYPAEEEVVEQTYDHADSDLEIPMFGQGKQ